MQNILLLAALGLSLSACAPQSDRVWPSDYMPPDPVIVHCQMKALQAGSSANGGWLYQAAVEQKVLQLCREANGR